MSKGIQFLFTCLCLCVVGGTDISYWGIKSLVTDTRAEVN